MAAPSEIAEALRPAPVGAGVSFHAVFEREHGYVWHSLRRLGVFERDLEDVTHDVFVVVHRKLGQYDASRPLRPWLFGVAARVASDYRRRASHRFEHPKLDVEAVDAQPSPEARLAASDAQKLVIAALQAVEEDRRAVLIAVEIDELPVTEVALALEIPLNTAYSRLRLARAEFGAAVARMRKRGEP
jgi:RNA polymerase sigma-70 factor (ECF subfamily)